jgi:hypothetical protein
MGGRKMQEHIEDGMRSGKDAESPELESARTMEQIRDWWNRELDARAARSAWRLERF